MEAVEAETVEAEVVRVEAEAIQKLWLPHRCSSSGSSLFFQHSRKKAHNGICKSYTMLNQSMYTVDAAKEQCS